MREAEPVIVVDLFPLERQELLAYTTDAWATLAKNPQDRSAPIREVAQKLGGQLVGLYYCFGEYDGVVLAEIPDDNAP